MSEPIAKEEINNKKKSAPIDIKYPPGFKKERPRRQYRFYSEGDYNPVRLVENVPGTSARNTTTTASTSTENKLDKVGINTADEAQCAIQYFNPLGPVGNVPGTSTQDAPITSNGDTQTTNSNSSSTQSMMGEFARSRIAIFKKLHQLMGRTP